MKPTTRHQQLKDFLDTYMIYPRFVYLLTQTHCYHSVADLCLNSYPDQNLIYLAFPWQATREGYDYWSNISDKFKAYKDAAHVG